MTLLRIGLSAWIIQDGNYPDFAVGETRNFAIEFYFSNEDEIAISASATPKITPLTEAHYLASGKVIFLSEEYSMLDFGQVTAYSGHMNSKHNPDMKLGDFISGKVYLGVDPFFFMEDLRAKPGVPDIIYSWKIKKILVETGPYILDETRKFMYRDPDKKEYLDIQMTNAWEDEKGGAGHYVMDCEK